MKPDSGRDVVGGEPSTSEARDVVKETTDVLIKALRALGIAGHPEDASRLAARAWSVLRESHPHEADT